MAIQLKEQDLRTYFGNVFHYWEDFDEFKEFYIKRLNERGEHVYYIPNKGEAEKYDFINHFPDTKQYDVWMEGYIATGESEKAKKVGSASARNFGEACHKVMCRYYLEHLVKAEKDEDMQYAVGRWDYDPYKLSYWERLLFDNERDARRSFG